MAGIGQVLERELPHQHLIFDEQDFGHPVIPSLTAKPVRCECAQPRRSTPLFDPGTRRRRDRKKRQSRELVPDGRAEGFPVLRKPITMAALAACLGQTLRQLGR